MSTKRNNGANKDQELWVWMLDACDLTEAESQISLWADHAGAKAAMEESIEDELERRETDPDEFYRDGDDYAVLGGYMMWTISKKKVNP